MTAHNRCPPFELVVEQYQQRLFNLVYRLFPDVDDAEDLVQEVFFRAWRAWDRFRSDADVYTWLYRITINLCRERIRSRRAARRLIVSEHRTVRPITDRGEIPDPCSEAPEATEPDLGESLEREELRLAVREAIARLPERFAQPILLRDIGGLSYEEMAKVMGVTLNAAGVRLNRARELLRRMLAGKLKDFL